MRLLLFCFILLTGLTYAQDEFQQFGKSNDIFLTKENASYSLTFRDVIKNEWFAIDYPEGYGHHENILTYSIKALEQKPKDGYLMELGQWYFLIEVDANTIFYTGILRADTDIRVRTPKMNKRQVLQLFGITDKSYKL